MAKPITQFICGQCGTVHKKWIGRCDGCGEWNTIVEEAPLSAGPAKSGLGAGKGRKMALMDLASQEAPPPRHPSGLAELDRVLGGGLVPASALLLGGDPGIGKSTLLLQAAASFAAKGLSVVYVSGEEASAQVRMRAQRLGLGAAPMALAAETNLRDILTTLDETRPDLVIIDSIQTMWLDTVDSAPGSVSQVRAAAHELVTFAKRRGVSVILVGHVTKDGSLAGPKVLEHMIDCSILLEGDHDSRYRTLRGQKNRFGAVNELGIFAMTDVGLREVSNPSAIFLDRSEHTAPGTTVVVVWEGTRPLLVEIQALVDDSSLGNPRRVTVGFEQNRLAMLLAVLHRHGGIHVGDQDVFANVVGGVRVMETSADLALLLAVVSSLRNRALPRDWVVLGEVGLSGEIRPVASGQERLAEAAKHGFKVAIVPKSNAPKKHIPNLKVIPVARLSEALDACS